MSDEITNVTQDTRNFSNQEPLVRSSDSVIDYTWLHCSRHAVCIRVLSKTDNALVLYVLSSRREELASTMFIMLLAVVDLVTCVFIVPFTVILELMHFNV
jgi:hypothetical protein